MPDTRPCWACRSSQPRERMRMLTIQQEYLDHTEFLMLLCSECESRVRCLLGRIQDRRPGPSARTGDEDA